MRVIDYFTIGFSLVVITMLFRTKWKIGLIIVFTGLFPVVYFWGGASGKFGYDFLFLRNFQYLILFYLLHILFSYFLIMWFRLGKLKTKVTHFIILLFPIVGCFLIEFIYRVIIRMFY